MHLLVSPNFWQRIEMKKGAFGPRPGSGRRRSKRGDPEEYSLTAFGTTLGKALAPLCEWGTTHSSNVEAIMERRKFAGQFSRVAESNTEGVVTIK
jgi:hypothetical protein